MADQDEFEKRAFPESWEDVWKGTRAWLEVRWGPDWEQRECPYCHEAGWVIGEVVVLRNDSGWPAANKKGGNYPVVQVWCSTCWQQVLLPTLAIFERKEKASDESDAEQSA